LHLSGQFFFLYGTGKLKNKKDPSPLLFLSLKIKCLFPQTIYQFQFYIKMYIFIRSMEYLKQPLMSMGKKIIYGIHPQHVQGHIPTGLFVSLSGMHLKVPMELCNL
jgi:hypothetical protein